jgi:phosphoglycolate phosphatase
VLPLVFDLDGTLIDSRRSIAAACNHALAAAGRAPLPELEIAGYVGDGARTLVARAFREEPRSAVVDAALVEFVRFYTAHPILGTTWLPGAREALGFGRATLVTNKARAITVEILRALDVAHLFVAVIAGGDGPLKPDPAPILAAVRALGAPAASTWVVGDGVQDLLAGKAAGCRTAAVLGGFTSEERLRAVGPDVVLASLEKIDALESFAGS